MLSRALTKATSVRSSGRQWPRRRIPERLPQLAPIVRPDQRVQVAGRRLDQSAWPASARAGCPGSRACRRKWPSCLRLVVSPRTARRAGRPSSAATSAATMPPAPAPTTTRSISACPSVEDDPVTGSATAAACLRLQKPPGDARTRLNFGPDAYLLQDRPAGCLPSAGHRQGRFHQHRQVGAVSLRRRMHGVPHAPRRKFVHRPGSTRVRIECVALVADPFRPELPTLLQREQRNQQFSCCNPAQYGADKYVGFGNRHLQARRQIGSGCRRAAQRTSPEPSKGR